MSCMIGNVKARSGAKVSVKNELYLKNLVTICTDLSGIKETSVRGYKYYAVFVAYALREI